MKTLNITQAGWALVLLFVQTKQVPRWLGFADYPLVNAACLIRFLKIHVKDLSEALMNISWVDIFSWMNSVSVSV